MSFEIEQDLYMSLYGFNPLSSSSDKHLISTHNITTRSNIQIVRMKKMINTDKMTWFYANSPNKYHKKHMKNNEEKEYVYIEA